MPVIALQVVQELRTQALRHTLARMKHMLAVQRRTQATICLHMLKNAHTQETVYMLKAQLYTPS